MMTPKKLDDNDLSHRRPKPEVTRRDNADDPADADDDMLDDELLDDELLATAVFAEDALSDDMLIGSADELDALDDETMADPVAEARARMTIDELLNRLVKHADDVALRDLFVLSDLSRAEADAVEAQWEAIPVDHRRRLIRELVESADELMELILGRLLRIALRDSDAEVRRLAIDGLWEETDPALIGAYVQMLNIDSDTGVRAAAASALGPFVLAGELDELDAAMAMRAEEALLAIVHGMDEPIAVQAKALESVAYSGEAGLRQLIEDAYYSPHEEMRLSALRAMGRSADTRWRSMVRAELTSPDAATRAEAALAAGELEIKAATPRILTMLRDDELAVRLAAIDALGHLGGKAARDALRALADEAEEEEAEAAEIALDEMLFYDELNAVALVEGEDDEDDDDLDDRGDPDNATYRDGDDDGESDDDDDGAAASPRRTRDDDWDA